VQQILAALSVSCCYFRCSVDGGSMACTGVFSCGKVIHHCKLHAASAHGPRYQLMWHFTVLKRTRA